MVLGGGGQDAATADDDWFVAGSDEEQTDPPAVAPPAWHPDPADILSMFASLEQNKMLELKWTCPGRRLPSPDPDMNDDGGGSDETDSEEDIKQEVKKAPEVSEFDFDDFGSEASTKLTPRRTPGSSKTPKSQKKVASMDNVLNNIRRQQKEKAALKEARRGMSRSPASPARFRLGMTGSPVAPKRPVSSTGTPLRPPSGDLHDSPASSPGSAVRDSKVSQTPREMGGEMAVKIESAEQTGLSEDNRGMS